MKRLKTWHKVVLGLLVLSAIGSLLPKKEVSATTSPPTEVDIKNENKIQKQFSSWDGSHRNLVKAVKESMNDPKSFEHVDTKYWVLKGDTVIIKMKYRGKNAFGGVVTEMVRATALPDGTVLEIAQQ